MAFLQYFETDQTETARLAAASSAEVEFPRKFIEKLLHENKMGKAEEDILDAVDLSQYEGPTRHHTRPFPSPLPLAPSATRSALTVDEIGSHGRRDRLEAVSRSEPWGLTDPDLAGWRA